MSFLLALLPIVAVAAGAMVFAYKQGVKEGRDLACEDITDHRYMAGSMHSDDFIEGLECAAGIAERGPLPWGQPKP